eukprot:Selendium_serpulae@DN6246_c0_g1_i1.p1
MFRTNQGHRYVALLLVHLFVIGPLNANGSKIFESWNPQNVNSGKYSDTGIPSFAKGISSFGEQMSKGFGMFHDIPRTIIVSYKLIEDYPLLLQAASFFQTGIPLTQGFSSSHSPNSESENENFFDKARKLSDTLVEVRNRVVSRMFRGLQLSPRSNEEQTLPGGHFQQQIASLFSVLTPTLTDVTDALLGTFAGPSEEDEHYSPYDLFRSQPAHRGLASVVDPHIFPDALSILLAPLPFKSVYLRSLHMEIFEVPSWLPMIDFLDVLRSDKDVEGVWNDEVLNEDDEPTQNSAFMSDEESDPKNSKKEESPYTIRASSFAPSSPPRKTSYDRQQTKPHVGTSKSGPPPPRQRSSPFGPLFSREILYPFSRYLSDDEALENHDDFDTNNRVLNAEDVPMQSSRPRPDYSQYLGNAMSDSYDNAVPNFPSLVDDMPSSNFHDRFSHLYDLEDHNDDDDDDTDDDYDNTQQNENDEFVGQQVTYADHSVSSLDYDIPNDPLFSEQWAHVDTDGFGANAPLVWKAIEEKTKQTEGAEGSKKFLVALIDSGVDYAHFDLRENIWRNKDEICGPK